MELTSKIQGLQREPFIGKNYFQLPKEDRLLIVGESHYTSDEKESTDINLTVNTVGNFGWNDKIKFFTNMRKIVLEKSKHEPSQLWNNCAFYNFIQSVMKSPTERPSKQDWIESWRVFFELMKFLEPTIVVFGGTSAANVLAKNKSILCSNEHDFDRVRYDTQIGKYCAKRTEITLSSGHNIRVLFLLHPSRISNIQPWREYFLKMSNGKLSYLTT